MKRLVVVALLLAVPARADVTADVTKDYTTFVTAVAGGKVPAGVELFIAPASDSITGLNDDFKKELPTPKLSNITVVPSKSGSSAWIVADLAGLVPGKDKAVAGTLRTSAFLVHDATGWHVRAAHWSAGKPERIPPQDNGCGMVDQEWSLRDHGKVAKALEPDVKAVLDALRKDFTAILSDDKRAITIGSAPNERFNGGAAVKKLFKRFKISNVVESSESPLAVVAGGSTDNDLMWIAMPVMAPHIVCTEYRAFYVLQREGSDWKVVHQHYSNWVSY